MVTVSPRQLVSENCKLYSLPDVVFRLNRMVDDPTYTAADFGNVISNDPALTARLLRIVNSPFYGFPSHVDTIPMAITILGTRQLRDLVLATSIVSSFDRVTGTNQTTETFWSHSTCCGLAAREIAVLMKLSYVERLFVAGLLHDIGKLVLQATLPERYQRLLERLQLSAASQRNLENEIFGFDHAEVSQELLRRWKFPESLIEPVGAHHTPQQATKFRKDAYILHLANHIANQIEAPLANDEFSELEADTWQALGLENSQLAGLHEQIARKREATAFIVNAEPVSAAVG